MRRFSRAFVGSMAVLAALGCGEPSVATAQKPAASAPKKPAAAKTSPEKPAPYTYPAPVKGHFEDENTGKFDLVDGIAYPGRGDEGTVIYVVAKPIASPVLAGSPCPMAEARALTGLRDAGWVEVTLDSGGRSPYFSSGVPFGGSGREQEVGGRYWSSKLTQTSGRAAGHVEHQHHGSFDFDLPVSAPKFSEVSEGDRVQGNRGADSGNVPGEKAIAAAYRAVREAALKQDLKALLAAQGFNEKQIAAIRGLEGIDADLLRFAERFLTPGAPDEFQSGPSYAAISGAGTNSKGAKFINYYWFAPCGGSRLVLTGITENPQ